MTTAKTELLARRLLTGRAGGRLPLVGRFAVPRRREGAGLAAPSGAAGRTGRACRDRPLLSAGHVVLRTLCVVLCVVGVLAASLVAPGPALAGPGPAAPLGRAATAVGTIRRAPEISICQQMATHLLVDDHGTVVYQLADAGRGAALSRYEGQRVLVVGTARGEPVEGCPLLVAVDLVVPLRH